MTSLSNRFVLFDRYEQYIHMTRSIRLTKNHSTWHIKRSQCYELEILRYTWNNFSSDTPTMQDNVIINSVHWKRCSTTYFPRDSSHEYIHVYSSMEILIWSAPVINNYFPVNAKWIFVHANFKRIFMLLHLNIARKIRMNQVKLTNVIKFIVQSWMIFLFIIRVEYSRECAYDEPLLDLISNRTIECDTLSRCPMNSYCSIPTHRCCVKSIFSRDDLDSLFDEIDLLLFFNSHYGYLAVSDVYQQRTLRTKYDLSKWPMRMYSTRFCTGKKTTRMQYDEFQVIAVGYEYNVEF
jgi:hypothetical protein